MFKMIKKRTFKLKKAFNFFFSEQIYELWYIITMEFIYLLKYFTAVNKKSFL